MMNDTDKHQFYSDYIEINIQNSTNYFSSIDDIVNFLKNRFHIQYNKLEYNYIILHLFVKQNNSISYEENFGNQKFTKEIVDYPKSYGEYNNCIEIIRTNLEILQSWSEY